MKNKSFIRYTVLLICALLFPLTTFSQVDWRTEIKKDLVEVQNGKFTASENMIINIEGNNLQVRMEAEADSKFISRDQFNAIYHTLGTFMLLGILEQSGMSIDQMDIKNLDDLIGDADITLKFIMAKNGIQIKIITNESTEQITMTWEELYQ